MQRLDSDERRQLWRRLEELLGSRPRALQRPDWLERPLAVLFCGSVFAVCFAPFITLVPFGWYGLVAVPLLVLGTIGSYLLTRPWRVYPPAGYETFGDITRRLVGLEAATVGWPVGSRDLLMADLRVIVSDQLGVEPDEVVPEARFVEDLNMG